jgi:aspartate/methionine/tyrosine aminotransferase
MRQRPSRLQHIAAIGVDRMGSIADASGGDLLRLENLDVDIPPDGDAIIRTQRAAGADADNSYLPFVGQHRLREVAAVHVSRMSGVAYSGDRNCLISAGGLSGILNVLLATIEVGDEVIVTDPTYVGLINRVRLAGGVPRFAPFRFTPGGKWTLDRDAMARAVGEKTRAMLLMSPSMPSGACFDAEDWRLIAKLCVANDLLLILDTAMERLVFDRREVIHPAGLPEMASRTISVGSSAKELRMIGWRVGWIVGPEDLMPDIVAVSLANVVVPVGIAQDAVATALVNSYTSIGGYVAELQARRDTVMSQLESLPFGAPGGGWSLLLRVADFGIDGETMSRRLLDHGVCATPMTGWGETHGAQYIRFVFANEPVQRLELLGARVRKALHSKPRNASGSGH